MKELIKIIALIAVTFNFSAVHAQDAKVLKSKLSQGKLSTEELDETYNQISGLVEAKRSKSSMKDLLEISVMYFNQDGTDAAYDFAYDLKKSNPKEFEKALNELSVKDREQIQKFIKLSEDEIKSGNG